ncbi:MAG: ribosome small subunit-dependent GTPase A [Clostridia bacterium]|nr:ribosome small subunit-dependent GTPase A [Clostridia bacterium]
MVGDYVDIEPNEYDSGKYIINKVLPRKNSIPRPPLANIDKLIIVIAPKPEPDLLLVDKLIIYCMINNIEPIIVINKSDLADEKFLESIKNQYYFEKICVVCAKNGSGFDELKSLISSSFCAVCGQSAVGKSSILNTLIPNIELQTQGLSRKIDRGKHTTRVNELYLYEDLMIADTPGFSSLELDIDFKELASFYPEFDEFLGDCKYLNCSHVKEGKDCAVVSEVESGKINKDRYQRYCDLYKNLKEKWDKKYD